jgi:hypothetical protein
VAQRFIEHSERAYARRDHASALASIKSGLEVEPGNETLLKLHDDHQRRVAAQTPRAPAATPRSATARPRQQATQNPIKQLWNNIFSR